MPHGFSREYLVVLPPDRKVLFRLVEDAHMQRIRDADFSSNAALGKRRWWPDEDATDYLGVSCYDTLEQAIANALVHDRRRKRGQTPRWRGVAEFAVDGHDGQTYADTFEEGHWTVWGEPERLRSGVLRTHPIDG